MSLPDTKRPHAVYCSRNCKNMASVRRRLPKVRETHAAWREKNREHVKEWGRVYMRRHRALHGSRPMTNSQRLAHNSQLRKRYRERIYGLDVGDNPLNYHRDRYRHARAVGKRSGLEVSVCAGLDAEGVPYHYEPFDIPYVPLKERRYKPDLVLDNGIILELKGFFKTEDRTKHLNVRHNHPDLDIRFVFSNPETRIGKKSQTTYRQWCVTKGFKFCKATEFPRSWLKEPVNQKSLAAIEALWERHKAKKK